ncbi:rhamnogalacturonan endolyase [Madurella fahalii]|uniref:rhamnogalacturonan endolyase n=1 Tax=Madurella fahalii TaxID=1157608 RepID=A0ABQ0FWH9_9PEZI
MKLFLFFMLSLWAAIASGTITASESSTAINAGNGRLVFSVNKRAGTIDRLSLDGQDLLGSGGRLYLDCHCDSGFWNGGSFQLYQGTDSSGTAYAGVRISANVGGGRTFESYYFLRDGETGLHTFGRAAYPNGGSLGEMRFLFRPSSSIWNHLSSSDEMWSVLPSDNGRTTVQDTTYRVSGDGINAQYRTQMSDYFSKYMFSESWEYHTHHGLFSDGVGTRDGSTYGAWLVMNTKDTYFNGPKWSDLTVDGIVYNYVISNHHGNGNPDTQDFDRTFGPQYYYFNKGAKGASVNDLRRDAGRFADPSWNADFYDSIARYVPGYIPTSGRGTWSGRISLPEGATKPIAVLASNGRDFQDNNFDNKARQYWGEISGSGEITIPRVAAGTYRLTIYGTGIFGQYIQDNIVIRAGATTTTTATWTAESAGTELWRIGTPDRSSGDFRHGNERDSTRTNRPKQHRLYWAVHDFPKDFPNGVNFHVGRSNITRDFNYIQWSVFGGKGNSIRPEPYYTNVNAWNVTFDATAAQLQGRNQATFTVQLAGVKTSAGNTDSTSKPFANLPYTVTVNGRALPVWTIPANQSSSCGARSAASCYNTRNKWTFDASYLRQGLNTFTLSLPARASAPESAVLPESVYLQYDALRLEVS